MPLQLLYVTTGITVIGTLIDTFTARRLPPLFTPQLPYLLAFLVWAFIATGVREKLGALALVWNAVGLSVIFMLAVATAITTYERFRTLVLALLIVGGAICAIGIHLGHQPTQCIVIDEKDRSEGDPDGRPCETQWICDKEGDPDKVYLCERAGLFGTFTEGKRVRWRGTLGDPNELAVFVGALLPFLFALNTIVGRKLFTLAVALALALGLYTVVLTGSRGGQLVVLTVFGVYFVRRFGLVKGIIVGAMLALPVVLLGGREGDEADSSSKERAELLYEGVDMIREFQPFGVGVNQFFDHNSIGLTAHNSYVLAAAELGIPGSVLWMLLVYISVKIPYVLATRPPAGLDARVPAFAYALVVSFAGILVGIFFLSFCYKPMLFIYFGLSGALFLIAKRADANFDVRVGWKEVVWVTAFDFALLGFAFVYSRIKGTG